MLDGSSRNDHDEAKLAGSDGAPPPPDDAGAPRRLSKSNLPEEEKTEEAVEPVVGGGSGAEVTSRLGAFPEGRAAYRQRKKQSQESVTSASEALPSRSRQTTATSTCTSNATTSTSRTGRGLRKQGRQRGDASEVGVNNNTNNNNNRSTTTQDWAGTAAAVSQSGSVEPERMYTDHLTAASPPPIQEHSASQEEEVVQLLPLNTHDEDGYPHLLEAVPVEEHELAVAVVVTQKRKRPLLMATGICVLVVGAVVGTWVGVSSRSNRDDIGLVPTAFPSTIPSNAPSHSVSPSGAPSFHPSDLPRPSDLPSSIPSNMPSGIPSNAPSSIPSHTPSDIPSDAPSRSSSPSFHPSWSPSCIPSQQPSHSVSPSNAPSFYPSYPPSQSPTEIAAFLPEYTQRSIALDANGTAPQSKALNWLVEHPDFATFSTWRKRQLMALATFYYAATERGIAVVIPQNWMVSDVSECFWTGQYLCDELGQLLTLAIREVTGLRGNIPPEISMLSSLSSLMLERIELSGILPTEMGLLTSLSNLILRHTAISGSIPSEIASINATSIQMEHNSLQGDLPTTLQSMVFLKELRLGNNHLSGSIMSGIAHMSSLRIFDVQSNNLTENLPSEVGDMAQLEEIYLQNNNLSGYMPSELGHMGSLRILDLHNNPHLNGTIPMSLANLESIEDLDLLNTAISGTVPIGICEMSSLSSIRSGCSINCTCSECSDCLARLPVILQGVLQFRLSEGAQVRPPTGQEIDGLIYQTERFYWNTFHEAFPNFESFKADFVSYNYNDSDSYPYQISLNTTSYFKGGYIPSGEEVVMVMQGADYTGKYTNLLDRLIIAGGGLDSAFHFASLLNGKHTSNSMFGVQHPSVPTFSLLQNLLSLELQCLDLRVKINLDTKSCFNRWRSSWLSSSEARARLPG